MDTQTATNTPEFTLGDRLRKAREWAGLTQQELADEMGVSRKTIVNYEHGATRASKLVLRAWSLTTKVPIEWLRGEDALTSGDSVTNWISDLMELALPA